MKPSILSAAAVGALVVLAVAYLITTPGDGMLQIAVTVFTLAVFLLLSMRSPVAGMLLVCATVPFLGTARRIVYAVSPVTFDLLLLIIPIYTVLMLLAAVMSHRERFQRLLRESRTARLVLLLAGLMVLEIANPLQGGIATGLAGAIYYLIPLCWFFLGKMYLTERTVRMIIAIFMADTLLMAAYGFNQTLNGMPAFDSYWVAHVHFAALHVGNTIRPLGTSTSPQEYTLFLAGGVVSFLALFLYRRNILLLLPASVLALALFFESSRGAIFTSIATFLLLIALRQRTIGRALAAIVAIVALGALGFQRVSGSVYQNPARNSISATGTLISHQVNGLANPFNSTYSTGGLHLQEVLSAFARSLTNPFGYGTGSTSQAASKFAGTGLSAEVDIANTFIAAGLAGGILYTLILVRTLRYGASGVFRTRTIARVIPFAVVATSATQTLNGALYSLMPFLWLFIAWIDESAPPRAERPPVRQAPPRWATWAPSTKQGIYVSTRSGSDAL